MKKVHFRFYEELNDFLPKKYKKKDIEHTFYGLVSIKDMIQSFNVPHTEVDLILINGQSVGFNYLVNDGDRISVYPEYESFDISSVQKLRPKPMRRPRFVLDVHLGKLARLMRMLGFDVFYENYLTDEQISDIAKKEKRCVLTRDVGILKRTEVERGYWLRNTDPDLQIVEVIDRFHLTGSIKEFTRCISCNGKLLEIDKELIKDEVPQKVLDQYNLFYYCRDCGKIYWKGSHYFDMIKNVNDIKEKLRKGTS
ncbi:MAG: Mut7-C ubiquitin/RNAse domain-containing protein [Melioribacteraceae bacterium]|nr:Mut7-C ubiquitin/RNAse domain-containing protein [Melioribacteraceae bacterium]